METSGNKYGVYDYYRYSANNHVPSSNKITHSDSGPSSDIDSKSRNNSSSNILNHSERAKYYGDDVNDGQSELAVDQDNKLIEIKYSRNDELYDNREDKKYGGYSYKSSYKKENVKKHDKISSVRRRYYEKADMDDVLQDKIATQLRENGISETKVVPLSAKITQAVRDDVIDANNKASPQVTSNLKEVINKHLDPILYNQANVTDLKDSKKPSDARKLSNLVLMRMGQVHEELDLCKQSVDEAKNKQGRSPRDESQERSMIMEVKDLIQKQKTENDILRRQLKKAQKETYEVTDDKDRRQEKLQNLDADNWQLKKDLTDTDRDRQNLLSKVKEQQKDYMRLDKQYQDLRQENVRLKNKLNDNELQNQTLSGDLQKLLSENARLKVLADQREKEILHLRDPDQDMLHQIKILSDEVTLLRTQTRRLNEEKGMLKSRSQKLEASLDESYKQKQKVTQEKDNLAKENEDLKQRYRKLALANPHQRTLPDIYSGQGGPSSRTHSRAHSRNVRSNDDRRMTAAQEEDEDDDYAR